MKQRALHGPIAGAGQCAIGTPYRKYDSTRNPRTSGRKIKPQHEPSCDNYLDTYRSCLDVLKQACVTRSFDVEDSSKPLQRAVSRLEEWLNELTPLRLWLPTLKINASIAVPRRDLLFIAGNQSKHNLSRLTGVSRRIADILRRNGHDVEPELIPLALDEFREHLHEDYFVYYGTWLAELIVTIRWGVQAYLRPIYERVYRGPSEGSVQYSYEMPLGIENDIGREWFWRLMDLVRRGPNVQPLQAARYLKAPVLRPET